MKTLKYWRSKSTKRKPSVLRKRFSITEIINEKQIDDFLKNVTQCMQKTSIPLLLLLPDFHAIVSIEKAQLLRNAKQFFLEFFCENDKKIQRRLNENLYTCLARVLPCENLAAQTSHS